MKSIKKKCIESNFITGNENQIKQSINKLWSLFSIHACQAKRVFRYREKELSLYHTDVELICQQM